MSQTCCPIGPSGLPLSYVDVNGNFFNDYTGTVMQILTWTNGNVTDLYGKCVFTQAAPAGYGDSEDPIECPCCAEGFTWQDWKLACVNDRDPKVLQDSIPCIDCICPPEEIVIEPCVGCQSFSGQPIKFSFQSDIKQCVDCVPQADELTTNTKLNCFAPYFLILPNINFKLD